MNVFTNAEPLNHSRIFVIVDDEERYTDNRI